MDFKNQIIGCMRFAYPAKEGFAVSRLSEDKLEEHLYDPDRINTRFSYLETITIPSMAAQKDKDFKLVILSGATMPFRFRKRLRAIEQAHDFVKVVFLERMGALGAAKRAFRRGLEDGTTHVTGFRIDDDDAHSSDYIGTLRDLSNTLISSGLARDTPFAVAWSRGIYWNMRSLDEPFYDFRETQPAGQACAMITTAELDTCIYRFNHRRLAAHVPTLMMPDGLRFIRTLHDHNDSNRRIPPHAEPMDVNKALKLMERDFGLDSEACLELVSGLAK